jgi:hypothetical protein
MAGNIGPNRWLCKQISYPLAPIYYQQLQGVSIACCGRVAFPDAAEDAAEAAEMPIKWPIFEAQWSIAADDLFSTDWADGLLVTPPKNGVTK